MIGLMYVNGKDWAIQSITARPISPDGGLDYEIIQNFEKLEGGKWFPSQILFKNVLDRSSDSSIMVGHGKAYFRDINLNPTKKESKIGIDNYVVEEFNLFKIIREAIYKEEITTLELPLIQEDYESEKTVELKDMFINMKYYANAK